MGDRRCAQLASVWTPLGTLCSPSDAPLPVPHLLGLCSKQLEGETEVSKLEALQWVHVLLSRDARLLQEQRQLLLLALCDALGAASGEAGHCCMHVLVEWHAVAYRDCMPLAAAPTSTNASACGNISSTTPTAPAATPFHPSPTDRVVTESLSVLASVAEQRDHFPAVIAALLDCFRGNGGARLLQVGRFGGAVLSCLKMA